jgi:hypothetical protein
VRYPLLAARKVGVTGALTVERCARCLYPGNIVDRMKKSSDKGQTISHCDYVEHSMGY